MYQILCKKHYRSRNYPLLSDVVENLLSHVLLFNTVKKKQSSKTIATSIFLGKKYQVIIK